MKEASRFLKQMAAYPAVTFWLAFIGIPTGVLSALALVVLDNRGRGLIVPPLITLLRDSQATYLARAGMSVSAGAFCFVLHTAHKFYSRLMDRSTRDFKGIMRFFVIVLDGSIGTHIISLMVMVFVKFAAHRVIFSFFNVMFFLSGLTFHSLIDYIAGKSKRYVPLSTGSNVVIGVSCVLCAVFYVLATAFGSFHRRIFTIGSMFYYVAMMMLSLKVVFAGMNLLGAKFLPGVASMVVRRPSYNSGSGSDNIRASFSDGFP